MPTTRSRWSSTTRRSRPRATGATSPTSRMSPATVRAHTISRMSRLEFVAPVLPMTDCERTVDHYGRLGFTVTVYNPEYVMVARDGVELHLGLMPDHDPKRTAGC